MWADVSCRTMTKLSRIICLTLMSMFLQTTSTLCDGSEAVTPHLWLDKEGACSSQQSLTGFMSQNTRKQAFENILCVFLQPRLSVSPSTVCTDIRVPQWMNPCRLKWTLTFLLTSLRGRRLFAWLFRWFVRQKNLGSPKKEHQVLSPPIVEAKQSNDVITRCPRKEFSCKLTLRKKWL